MYTIRMSDSFLTPVSRTTLTADVCRQLVGHLVRGDWAEGDRLPPERELCTRLGVGRASLREALKALEIMGMIETRLGDGTFVCSRSEFFSRPLLWAITASSDRDIDELTEARKLIEIEMAGLAAQRAAPEELASIGHCLDRMEAAIEDRPAFLEADLDFHLAIGNAAHNRILMNALHLIRNLMRQWIAQTLLTGASDLALKQHKQIFLAMAKRSPERAREAMNEHLTSMAKFLLEAQQNRIRDGREQVPAE